MASFGFKKLIATAVGAAALLVVASIGVRFLLVAPSGGGPRPETNPSMSDVDGSVSAAKEGRLLFVGDIMLDRGVRAKTERVGRGDPGFPFERAREYLSSFDAVVANLEGPASDAGERVGSMYSFRMNPDVFPALRAANIRAVNFANNHAWDYGRAAFEDTLARLGVAGIGWFGAGRNAAEAYAPHVLDTAGTKVALLGFTEFLEPVAATRERSGIAFADPERIHAAVAVAKTEADVVITSFHWGEEYRAEPVERQRALARAAIDAGADLVVGHHPHVIESHETYRGKDIYYSLGNFVFDQSFSTSTMTAGYLEVSIGNHRIIRTDLRQGSINRDFQPCPPEVSCE